MKIRRIKPGCCGMVMGVIYDAKWDIRNFYVSVKVNGEWSSSHWFPGFFEEVV